MHFCSMDQTLVSMLVPSVCATGYVPEGTGNRHLAFVLSGSNPVRFRILLWFALQSVEWRHGNEHGELAHCEGVKD